MSIYLVVAIPVADVPDIETAVGAERIIARIGGTKAPWRRIPISTVSHEVYSLTLRNTNVLGRLKTAFPNMNIICRWRREDGLQDTDRMKQVLYLRAMPDDVDELEVRTRPTVIRQVVRPHDDLPDLDMSEV